MGKTISIDIVKPMQYTMRIARAWWTDGQTDGQVVSWMVGGSGGQRSRESECWTVGRSDGAGTLGRSQGREVGEKVNLGHGQLDNWRGDTRR